MKFYTGVTLVDITATGVTRHRTEQELERNQQRNWETVLQCIGLRSQPQLIEGPICREYLIDETTRFGEMYHGLQKCWIFTFGVDSEDVFLLNDDPVGGLDKDFAQVPIICGLEETARFILPIFYPFGAIKNIYFLDGRIQLNTI
ncbi:hypothetical protein UFOVP257_139 [uncultured Caudovirales phage]|uniref:Uncharacterized protein n=1 Tax=uncultured Caudovirales phage TaxID=2100421 RepID=A0A6J5LGI9_9CAUD|nr:hypothetical protein UFOVP257_139 [uncultured Caudovirales phage]